jgi:uncharacterized membrane protein
MQYLSACSAAAAMAKVAVDSRMNTIDVSIGGQVAVFLLTSVSAVYLILNDTEYRDTILIGLIAANILAYIAFVLKRSGRPPIWLSMVYCILLNPATYLAIVYGIDQTSWDKKKAAASTLFGVIIALSLSLTMIALYR